MLKKKNVESRVDVGSIAFLVYLIDYNFFKIIEYFIFLQLLKGHKVDFLCETCLVSFRVFISCVFQF